jgi:hypothetical protein
MKLHKDTQTTDDSYLAALAHFSGCRIWRCEVPLTGNAVFHVLCPEYDWKIITSEYEAEDSSLVNIRAFVTSIRVTHSLIRKAKQAGGIYSERVYAV